MVRLAARRRGFHVVLQCSHAVSVNYCYIPQPSSVKEELSEVEKEGLRRGNGFVEKGRAYAMEHATKPSTIGLVLASSPLALLAWYVPTAAEIYGADANELQDRREISCLDR